MLEGGKPLVRNGSVDQRTVLRSRVQQNCNLVGKAYEDVPPKPISPIHVYRHRGTGHGGARKVCSATKASPTDVMGYNFTSGCRDKENSRIGFRVTFVKARGDHSSSRGGGKRQSKFRGGPASCKTSEPGISSAVQCRSSDDCTGTGNAQSNAQVDHLITEDNLFIKFLDDIPQEKVKHTITRTRRTSKVALPSDYNLPLHVKSGIPDMQVNTLRRMMNSEAERRFAETWDTLVRLPSTPAIEQRFKSFLPPADISALLETGVISRVGSEVVKARPSMEWVIPFTVVEPADDDSERRRFIAWTRGDNNRIREEYKPEVPVCHAAYYLHRVRDQCAIKRDLACGFWQVKIPVESRQKFRFRDEEGTLYEMNVMPMGHRCAPEIMHTLTATIGGDPRYCNRDASFPGGGLDVYIDGIRFAGEVSKVNEYARFIDRRAINVNAKFKDHGDPPMDVYTFNGVTFFHRDGKVSLGPKLTRRLQSDDFLAGTYGSLEAGVGRLIFASAIMGICMPEYHLELKIVRRRICRLNREPNLLDDKVPLPTSVRIRLMAWRDKLLYRSPVTPPRHPDTVPHQHTLFTDASSVGWGAVLYLDYGPMFCTGAQWPADFNYEVNRAEARAVRLAFEKFQIHFKKDTCVDLFIDNTSCVAAVNRKVSKSNGITEELRRLLHFLNKNGLAVKAEYVRSSENPADHYSRYF